MVKDNKSGLPFKPAVLRDRDGDLTKPWYVEFYAFDEKSGGLVRKRVSISMNFRDKKSRTAEGNRIVGMANDLLKKGYHFPKQGIAVQPGIPPEKEILVKALQFSLNAATPALGEKSTLTYQSALNKFMAYPEAAGMTVDQFETRHAILFRDYLLTELKNAPRTANNTIQHLQVIFSRFQERTGIKENPFKFKSLRETATERNIAFSDADRATVEEYLLKHEPGVYFFTRLMYFAFIRPGELLKLQVRHVHMPKGYITVHGLIAKNGKTETAQIIPALANELQSRINFERPEHYLFSSDMEQGKFPLYRSEFEKL
ncbi:tyrosine-type recombinase/integrase [Dyadobacter fermentans]|uniref:Tyr recombinase domain-containing protein n=1 Tax=Dyadobacter fermentans (strain ATCC 700827 / DSM 18053 / CIP 107007 / KCTC 52180 / NS114) TaxID=471854 RepID=C6VVD5_DYAFD|nr:site-specific integrase [Dyadobacter fermentans]ACT96665.1 hypothetical protein Dfer_5474 [Dyadobacter fermentans DSM 18053]